VYLTEQSFIDTNPVEKGVGGSRGAYLSAALSAASSMRAARIPYLLALVAGFRELPASVALDSVILRAA
jgi:hypothetical protein